ncbi:LPS-assembly lipoprotein LptE [Acinetobacter larvae]|uniref:LPS-assembly lipoprotein LptE n=1 Tax=Acinetobacter larvae TaxID=1789224 RepID=A0A1B2M243_9GAMM|nr:hypothetical protein [Acinetobacter larvae]AOA59221.1 hypothetical protein BFG52_13210 [Acinetobacter larvae]
MHFVQRIAAIVITLGLSASMVGCAGFHLKGTSATTAPLSYSKLQLALPADARPLEKRLSVDLTAAGIQMTAAEDAYVLRILEYQPRRLELSGKLVETLLRLSVTFQIEDRQGRLITEPRTVMANRSYQYDVATVNTEDQQNRYLQQVLIDDIARQITHQVVNNRLPKAQGTLPSFAEQVQQEQK